MNDGKYYAYVGPMSEVFKPGLNQVFQRGIPVLVPDLYDDMFVRDPLYIPFSDKDALKVLKAMKTAQGQEDAREAVLKLQEEQVAALRHIQEERLAQWKKDRDRTRIANVTTVELAPPGKARPEGGGE